jgi:hypothetical protein
MQLRLVLSTTFCPSRQRGVVHVHVQFDRLFHPGRILRVLLQIRQYKASEVVPSEYFVRVKSIDAGQAFTSTKDRNRRF